MPSKYADEFRKESAEQATYTVWLLNRSISLNFSW